MADPFAPPEEHPATPRPGQVYPPMTGTAPPGPAPVEAAPRAPRANPGPFWMLAAIGVAAVCLARLIWFFVGMDDLEAEEVLPGFLGVAGVALLSLGLTLAAVLQRGLAVPWRIALLLGGGYFAVVAGWPSLAGLFFL